MGVAKKKKSLKKPTKKKGKDHWDYHEVTSYLEKLHKKDFRNYAGKTWGDGSKASDNAPYLDFWHWLIGNVGEDINGRFIQLPEWYDDKDQNNPDWVKEIMGFYKDFLGEEWMTEELWVEW